MNTLTGVLLAVLPGLFVASAWRGEGFAHRIAQSIWCRIGSLANYRKTGERHASLTAIVNRADRSVFEHAVSRLVPALSGWFSPFPTDKGEFHDYLRLYEIVLLPYRDRPDVRVLEVGVNKGGSLALWREYFSERAAIFGIDVNPGVQTFPSDAGIKVVILDSRDSAAVAGAFRGLEFDVIIDDGLHDPGAQRHTFDALRPLLKPSGVYVIEDVYAFDAAGFHSHGDAIRIYPERNGQSLVVVRPPACDAGEPPDGLPGR